MMLLLLACTTSRSAVAAGDAQVSTDDLKDLPLIEVPPTPPATDWMAIHLTGDGGWGVTDNGIARDLADHGIPVLGLNSQKYFWRKRSPEEAARDFQRILEHYTAAWARKKVIVVGYSLGADVLPFMINRLPEEDRSAIRLLVLLGPSPRVDFKVHVQDIITGSSSVKGGAPVLPELKKLQGMRILCFYSEGDRDSIAPQLASDFVKVIQLKGGHRIRGNFGPVVEGILEEIK